MRYFSSISGSYDLSVAQILHKGDGTPGVALQQIRQTFDQGGFFQSLNAPVENAIITALLPKGLGQAHTNQRWQ